MVHTPRGLERLVAGQAAYLQLPVMLQQYVDHGGCLFKVYVLGDTSGEPWPLARWATRMPASWRRSPSLGAPTSAVS